MRIFEEKQRFRQWWLIAIIIFSMGGLYISVYQQTKGLQEIESNVSLILIAIFATILLGSLFLTELRTKINSSGVKVEFYPFRFLTKQYAWSNIDQIYVRKYFALKEYGGWGIRFKGGKIAYSISGNYGIQIVTKQNKRLLIGTRKHQEAEGVLKRFQNKIQH